MEEIEKIKAGIATDEVKKLKEELNLSLTIAMVILAGVLFGCPMYYMWKNAHWSVSYMIFFMFFSRLIYAIEQVAKGKSR